MAAQEQGDPASALRWLDRAHRLLPEDGLVAITLGSLRLQQGDADGAATLLTPWAPTVPDAGIALTRARLIQSDRVAAAAALALVLDARALTSDLVTLARAIGLPARGVWPDGRPWSFEGNPT